MTTTIDHRRTGTAMRSGPPYYCENGHGPNWNHGTCWCGGSYLAPEAGHALPLATLALAVLAALAVLLGARVGAAEDWAPAQADTYIDLLAKPYVAEPGHGPSLHATCAPGGAGVEIAVHPFDEVARNFQVWDTSPPAPMLLDNVTEADWSAVYPFGWLAVLYSGTDRYDLVSPDQQRALCLATTTSSSTPTTETSTTVPSTSSSAPPPVDTPPSTEAAPPVTSTPDSSPQRPEVEVTTTTANGSVCLDPAQACATGVLTSSQRRTILADTGIALWPLIVAGVLLIYAGILTLTIRRLNNERRSTRPLSQHLASTTRSHEDGRR